tara:strand:- start:811 stop:1902 length:1092 start_codon:yes stop_codon:yes gene_type:complete
MTYIPENKYQVLYTNGFEYKFHPPNSRPYIGKYIKLDNGKVFAGDHPSRTIGALTPINPPKYKNIKPGKNNNIYSILKPSVADEQGNSIPIPPKQPTPTAMDYSRGYFYRYFSVRLNTKQYKEISKTTFQNFNKEAYNKGNNRVFQIEWNLSENNEELNTKTLTRLNYQLPGIFNFFPDKSQFGLKRGVIQLNQTSRMYPIGEIIPKQLPAAYQIGNEHVNTITNQEVPESQHCGNCTFFKENGHCKKWQANVKVNYWCRVWAEIQPLPPSNPPINDEDQSTSLIENLYTDGGEYLLDGQEYIGPYHIHPDNGPMVGAQHIDQPHAYLTPMTDTTDSSDTTTTSTTSMPSGPSSSPSSGRGGY